MKTSSSPEQSHEKKHSAPGEKQSGGGSFLSAPAFSLSASPPPAEPAQMKQGNPIQQKSGGDSGGGIPNSVMGQMEGALGADFSDVNIHENSSAASNVGALAYTQGNDVHFAPGQLKPDTKSGQELIGHELTHVVQQRQGQVKPTTQAGGMPVNDDPKLEKEADDKGKQAAQFKSSGPTQFAGGRNGNAGKDAVQMKSGVIQRKEKYEESNTAVANIGLIKSEWASQGDGDKRKLAYILATVEHECGYHSRKERRPTNPSTPEQEAVKADQDVYWPTGFYGRGFVQLTHKTNYEKMTSVVGEDLVANPDKALIPEYAAKISVYGMIHGSFTTKKLSHYFKDGTTDWVNARRIINGTDRASDIGTLAEAHYARLGGADGGDAYYSSVMSLWDYQKVMEGEGLLTADQVDGVTGPTTKGAIKAFKAKYNLPNPNSAVVDETTHKKYFELQKVRIGEPGGKEESGKSAKEIWDEYGGDTQKVATAMVALLPDGQETVDTLLKWLYYYRDDVVFYMVQQMSVSDLKKCTPDFLQYMWDSMDGGWTTTGEYEAMGKLALAKGQRIQDDERAAAHKEQDEKDTKAMAEAPTEVTLVLTGHVGGGTSPNAAADVKYVKDALKEMSLITDKEYESESTEVLAGAIKRYQKRLFSKSSWWDGVVEKGKTTEKRLIARVRGVAKSDEDRMEYILAQEQEGLKAATADAPSTQEKVKELYDSVGGNYPQWGALLADYVAHNSALVDESMKYVSWWNTDSLAYYIVKNTSSSDLAKADPALIKKMYDSMSGGWTVNDEFKMMAKLKPYYKADLETDKDTEEEGGDAVTAETYLIQVGNAYIRDEKFAKLEGDPVIPKYTEVIIKETKANEKGTEYHLVTSPDGETEYGWTWYGNLFSKQWDPKDHEDEYKAISSSYYDMMSANDPKETRKDLMMSGTAAKANIDKYYPNRTEMSSLDNGFRGKLEKMLAAFNTHGINYTANAGLRHPLRSVVLNYSVGVSKASSKDVIIEANAVCEKYGIPIDWAHKNEDGTIDVATSKAKGKELMTAFNIANRAARGVTDFGGGLSNHNHGKAVDLSLSFTFTDTKTITQGGKEYEIDPSAEVGEEIANIDNTPLSKMGKDNWGITRALDDDTVHWSYTGR